MRIKCSKCGNDLFYLHVPPKNTPKLDRFVYLICNECQKAIPVHFGTLPNVSSEGVLSTPGSYKEYAEYPKSVGKSLEK